MAVTPNSLSFTHKQGATLPPARIVNYTHSLTIVVVEGVPEWLNVSANNTSANIKLKSFVNTLSGGTHTATITFKAVELLEIDINKYETEVIGTVTVSVVVTETVVLSLSPSNLTFTYELGGANPASQLVNVVSENAWTISENITWLTLSTTSGSNNGSFQVSVTPAGLAVGTHTVNITVNDGVTTKTLPISLVISEPSTGTNYLYVTPASLNFGFTKSGVIPPSKKIEMNSSGSWTATSSASWVKLTVASGVAGVGTLSIGVHNLNALSVGNHFATVSITTGNIVKTISIRLSIYAFAQELLTSNELYFTEENNIIKVSSGRTDTHLQIKASTVFEGESFEVSYNNPFYKGVAQKRIGLEAKKIIGDRTFIGVGGVALFKPYTPVSLNLSINEVELFTSFIAQTINVENINFLKGITPFDYWMSDLPRTIYTTKKGIVLFSFLGNKYAPINELKVTGAVSKTYSFSNSIEPFYTAVLPISPLNVDVGDELLVTVKNVAIKVIIKPEEKEQSFVFWENQWGCWDCFEFTGEFTAASKFKEKSFEYRKDYKTSIQKVLSIKNTGTYKIATGWLYSNAELVALQKMLKSTNIYLYKNNELVKVKSTTRKLELYKTDKHLKSYNLTFENVEI